MTVLDIHTHNLAAREAVISCAVDAFDPQPGLLYSVGIHPWHSASATDGDLERLASLVAHPQVVAIGETGLDTLRGAPLNRQLELLQRHIAIAEQVGKPVIAHCVRASQQLAALWRRTAPHRVAIAVHGFRGNVAVARTLLDAGCWLSYGERHNLAAVAVTPPDRLLVETDDAPTAIGDVVTAVAHAMGIAPADLEHLARRNAAAWLAATW